MRPPDELTIGRDVSCCLTRFRRDGQPKTTLLAVQGGAAADERNRGEERDRKGATQIAIAQPPTTTTTTNPRTMQQRRRGRLNEQLCSALLRHTAISVVPDQL